MSFTAGAELLFAHALSSGALPGAALTSRPHPAWARAVPAIGFWLDRFLMLWKDSEGMVIRFPAGPVATGWAVRRARSTYLGITAVRTGQGLPGHPVPTRGCRRGEPMCQITLRVPGAAYATSDQNRSGPAAGDGANRPSHRVKSHTVYKVRPHPGETCLSRRPQVLEVERPPPPPATIPWCPRLILGCLHLGRVHHDVRRSQS